MSALQRNETFHNNVFKMETQDERSRIQLSKVTKMSSNNMDEHSTHRFYRLWKETYSMLLTPQVLPKQNADIGAKLCRLEGRQPTMIEYVK